MDRLPYSGLPNGAQRSLPASCCHPQGNGQQ
jgi:hypothetical protein